MLMLVNVPAEDYALAKMGDYSTIYKGTHIAEAIINGIVFNTDDLVSRKELLKHTQGGDYDGCGGFTREYVTVNDINSIPTAISRSKGTWKLVHPLQADDGGAYMCSECKTGNYDIEESYKYCPWCGSEMQFEEKEESTDAS